MSRAAMSDLYTLGGDELDTLGGDELDTVPEGLPSLMLSEDECLL